TIGSRAAKAGFRGSLPPVACAPAPRGVVPAWARRYWNDSRQPEAVAGQTQVSCTPTGDYVVGDGLGMWSRLAPAVGAGVSRFSRTSSRRSPQSGRLGSQGSSNLASAWVGAVSWAPTATIQEDRLYNVGRAPSRADWSRR